MMHPVMAHEYAKARQQDILKQADNRRLARQARGAKAPRPNLMEEMGNLLIDAGQRLKARRVSPNGEAIEQARA